MRIIFPQPYTEIQCSLFTWPTDLFSAEGKGIDHLLPPLLLLLQINK